MSIVSINFLHFAIILFVICSIVLISVSMLTERDSKKVDHITVNWKKTSKSKDSIGAEAYFSLGLCLAVAVIWYYFS